MKWKLGPNDSSSAFSRGPSYERSATMPTVVSRYDSIFFRSHSKLRVKTLEELEEEIEVTVVHEVAHYVGMTEKRLAELGYG
jgi:predicted Zn-dependent protease with MMP-like domain